MSAGGKQDGAENQPGCVGGHNPIGVIEQEHALQLKLCDALEAIADHLPDQADPMLALEAVQLLRDDVSAHAKLEEERLFPLLRRRASAEPTLAAMLERLEDEHTRDQDLANELADELELFAKHGALRNAEMLGYMLRGFFEGQRRHIEWENKVVLPLARRVLMESDIAELAEGLAKAVRNPTRKSYLEAWHRLRSGKT